MTAPRTPAILGIDLGTTEVKVGLVGLDGRLLGLARAGYPTELGPGPGHAEQDPGAWWAATIDAAREVLAERAATTDVVAIAADGHGPTLVAVDAEARPTRPAIIWLDTRAGAEAEVLADASGVRGWALAGLPAALWVERREPAVAARTRWYLTTWEYLALRLSGRAASPRTPNQLLPEPAAVARVGIPLDRLPEPTEAGAAVGGLAPEVASALGLVAGIPVVGGLVDAFASYLGAGLLEPGDAYDPGGAAGGFGVYWDRPVEVPGLFVTPAPLEGRFSIGAAMAATGRSLDWFRDGVLGGARSTEALLEEAAAVPPGADGLVFLPYLAGERSPLWDPEARGLFAGLTLDHRRGHLVRAIVEASALAIRHVAEPVMAAGVRVHELRVCGGPARSPFWNQVKADVIGLPVAVPRVLETGVLGSAILGAVGVGAYPDLRTAIGAMTAIEARFEARAEHRATYDAAFRAYVGLYPATAPILHELGRAGR
jgi:xylulokinase